MVDFIIEILINAWHVLVETMHAFNVLCLFKKIVIFVIK